VHLQLQAAGMAHFRFVVEYAWFRSEMRVTVVRVIGRKNKKDALRKSVLN